MPKRIPEPEELEGRIRVRVWHWGSRLEPSLANTRGRKPALSRFLARVESDRSLKAAYAKMAKARQQTIEQVVKTDFHHGPVIWGVQRVRNPANSRAWVEVEAEDDGGIASVWVAIRDRRGWLLEQGPAVCRRRLWVYEATPKMLALRGGSVEAVAFDRPGNSHRAICPCQAGALTFRTREEIERAIPFFLKEPSVMTVNRRLSQEQLLAKSRKDAGIFYPLFLALANKAEAEDLDWLLLSHAVAVGCLHPTAAAAYPPSDLNAVEKLYTHHREQVRKSAAFGMLPPIQKRKVEELFDISWIFQDRS